MQTTRPNPFATLAAFIVGTLFLLGLSYGVYIAVQSGIVALPKAQTTYNGQPPARPPVFDQRPALVPPAPQVQPAQSQPQAAPAPTAGPVYQATGSDAPASGEAAPAGAPMTDEYKATINTQQRTNDKGEYCAPRSGCTKPGSGGALAWPEGR